jgi:hypothetical protein
LALRVAYKILSSVVNLGSILSPVFTLTGFGVVVAFAIFTMKGRRIFTDIFKKNEQKESAEKSDENKKVTPTITEISINIGDIEKIKSELRRMDIEKEITGYALTRLYEVESEGKITEKDRVFLLDRYSGEMQRLDKEIEKKNVIVKLHDLEETKASLINMIHTKLDEVNKNIDSLKNSLGIKIVEQAQSKIEPLTPVEIPTAKVKKEEEKVNQQKPRMKSKAEEKIEAIQEEVLKVLERLEQIETEE